MEELCFTKEQEGILDIQKMFPEKGVCNIGGSVCFMLSQDSDVAEREEIKHIFELSVRENCILTIQVSQDYQPYLSGKEIQVKEWEGMEKPTKEELSLWLSRPFSFFDAPLYEICLFEDEKRIEYYVKVHHILMDGYSVAAWMRHHEERVLAGVQKDNCMKLHTGGFLEQMNVQSGNKSSDTEWFHQIVKGLNSSEWKMKQTSLRDLSVWRIGYSIPSDLYAQMQQVTEQYGLSAEILVTAALLVYISGVTGSDFAAIGRTMLNRRKKEMNMYGMKANTIPVCMNIKKEQKFFDLCLQIKQYFYEMMRRSSFCVKEYQAQQDIKENYYDVAVSYRSQKYIPFFQGQEQQEIANMYSELPMRVFINETEDGLRLEVVCQQACYSQKEVGMIVERLSALLAQGLTNIQISEMSLLSETDIKIWTALNENEQPNEPETTVPACIKEQADKLADTKVAVCCANESMTYQDLEETAKRVAVGLKRQGVSQGDIVGVHMCSRLELPAVFYGIWKVGASFLPISIRESEKRVTQIAQNCRCVCDDTWIENILMQEQTEDEQIMEPATEATQIAYQMCTSGTTGEPKIAMITHHSLMCRLLWMQEKYHCGKSVLQKAAYTFDVSVWEYFLPLMTGGTLVLAEEEDKTNIMRIAQLLQNNSVQSVHFVPSMLAVFLKYVKENPIELPHLEHVFSSGEALSAKLVAQFREVFKDKQLHNLYGPTECTIDVTYYDVDMQTQDKEVPIGRPVWWTQAEIVDGSGKCLPVGVEGNLIIKGALVGAGYLGQDSELFKTDLHGIRSYDTGDRAILGFDGQIYYRGRTDSQCKINGMRIDLAQIQSAILEHPDISRAVVQVHGKQLVAVYMAKEEITDLAKWLSARLSYYNVPSRLIYQNEIPLSRNGKTDNEYVHTLLQSQLQQHVTGLQTLQEKKIYECVTKKLGYDVSVDENLFLAGLDSLSLMEILIELEQHKIFYKAEDFYQGLTIRNIAQKDADGLQWLIRSHNKKLVVGFLYAAGTAAAFEPLIPYLKKEQVDFCVAGSPKSLPDLSEYDEIVLLGYCTGTAQALQGLEVLQGHGIYPRGMILCAALPPKAQAKSPWKKCTKRQLMFVMNYLHGKRMPMNEAMVEHFRKDTDAFFAYFHERRQRKKVKNVTILFGESDVLTLGSKYRWKDWNNYVQGKMHMRLLRGERHFFIDSKADVIAEEIFKQMQDMK